MKRVAIVLLLIHYVYSVEIHTENNLDWLSQQGKEWAVEYRPQKDAEAKIDIVKFKDQKIVNNIADFDFSNPEIVTLRPMIYLDHNYICGLTVDVKKKIFIMPRISYVTVDLSKARASKNSANYMYFKADSYYSGSYLSLKLGDVKSTYFEENLVINASSFKLIDGKPLRDCVDTNFTSFHIKNIYIQM